MRLIDADALKESLKESRDNCSLWLQDCKEARSQKWIGRAEQALMTFNECLMRIDTIPTIEALEQQQWIPVTYRPAEGDELKHYMYMFTCDMPADEQDILVTVKGRHGTLWVERDVNYCEDGFTLDSGNDWRDVEAWMPLPSPYSDPTQKEGEDVCSV